MKKIEGSAHFQTSGAAMDAMTALSALRHDDSNAIVGGGHALSVDDAGIPTVTVSYRLREGTGKTLADKLETQIADILGKADLTRGEVPTDIEHVFDPTTRQVVPRRANRVVQTLDDGSERVLTVRDVLGDVTHPDTGDKVGVTPIRSVYDQDGVKVQFDGPRGAPDPSVNVEKL